MRHQYTPIFSDLLTSRIWAMAPSTRAVWIWFMLRADPEGFVCTDTHGVALGANVTLDAAKEAMTDLTEIDPDAPDQGAVLERVPRGWRVIGFEAQRDLAKSEARKARQRRYMKGYRAANDTAGVNPSPTSSPEPVSEPECNAEPVNVTPPKPKPKSLSEDGEIPPTPHDRNELVELSDGSTRTAGELIAFADGVDTVFELSAPVHVVPPPVIHAIPATWRPSESLRADATMAGVGNLDERLASLRGGPIGGTRGVFESSLEDYVRSFFGKWRTWEETDRAKLKRDTSPGKPGYSGSRIGPVLEPTAKHRAYAKKHSLPLDQLVRELVEAGAVEDLGAKRALEILGQRMSDAVRERGNPLEAA